MDWNGGTVISRLVVLSIACCNQDYNIFGKPQQETEKESIEKEAVNCDAFKWSDLKQRHIQSFVIVIYQFTYTDGTSLLNHLDVSGNTEVSSLLVDPLTILV